MRKETYQNKLAALLGQVNPELAKFQIDKKSGKPLKEVKNYNRPVPITEDEIQEFRAMQGVIYFLQAPELFRAKKCKHCDEPFLVSRQYVAFCSYTCIRKDLEEKGLKWHKGHDLEALAQDRDVYDGNEPIWIRNLDRLKAVLESITDSDSQSSLASLPPTGTS